MNFVEWWGQVVVVQRCQVNEWCLIVCFGKVEDFEDEVDDVYDGIYLIV